MVESSTASGPGRRDRAAGEAVVAPYLLPMTADKPTLEWQERFVQAAVKLMIQNRIPIPREAYLRGGDDHDDARVVDADLLDETAER